MDSSKTVWMGNIDNTVNEQFIRKIFKSLSKIFLFIIYIDHKILKINISRRNHHKNGSAFIEFNSYQSAKSFIQEYNNKIVCGRLLLLNWAKHSNNIKYNNEKENPDFYTVCIIKYKM